MKKLLLSFGLAFLTASASVAQDPAYSGKFLVERVYLMPFVFKYAAQLGLDQQQINTLKEFVKEHEKKVSQNVQLIEYLDRKAKILILNGGKEEELRQVLSDIAYLKTELSLMNAESVRFIKKTLTKDQFEKLKDIIVVRLFELSQ